MELFLPTNYISPPDTSAIFPQNNVPPTFFLFFFSGQKCARTSCLRPPLPGRKQCVTFVGMYTVVPKGGEGGGKASVVGWSPKRRGGGGGGGGGGGVCRGGLSHPAEQKGRSSYTQSSSAVQASLGVQDSTMIWQISSKNYYIDLAFIIFLDIQCAAYPFTLVIQVLSLFQTSPPPSSSPFWQVPNTVAAASNHRRLNRGLLPTPPPPYLGGYIDLLLLPLRPPLLLLLVGCAQCCLASFGGRRREEEEEQAASILKDETRSQLRITNTRKRERKCAIFGAL